MDLSEIILELRNKRNQLLFQTDKYMLPDYPITPENLEKIKIYRQQLREFFQTDEVKNYSPITLTLPDFPF